MPSSVSEPEVLQIPRLASLPELFADRTLGTYDPSVSESQRAAHQAALHYVEHGGRNLVLIGPPGAGKSHLLAGICNAIWHEDFTAYRRLYTEAERLDRNDIDGMKSYGYPPPPSHPRWVNVPDLISRLRASYGAGGLEAEARFEAREIGRHRGLVVLDDLGREPAREASAADIYVLINTRYEAGRRTLVSSNLPVVELEAAGYGPAVSRLAEGGRLIEMAKAVDYRRLRKPVPA